MDKNIPAPVADPGPDVAIFLSVFSLRLGGFA
jgi:hypothetical protein